jgi:thiamine-phosphate pyrophosphorylase
MNPAIARILDANCNRAREALRVLEDYARLGLNDGGLSGELKTLRHDLAGILGRLGGAELVLARDTPGDPGVGIKTPAELERGGLFDVLCANAKRLTEALRVLEELGKTFEPAAAANIENIRYRCYALEQRILRSAGQQGRLARVRLYVLLTEALCRRPWDQTLEALLAGGADCIQLREKNLSDCELLRRARILVEKCRSRAVVSIINDRVDVALAAGADGVHLGQQDMPCAIARKIAGRDMIIGISTQTAEQARAAVRDGATYIAIGPMFPTQTKIKPRLAGVEYAREIRGADLPIPSVAIGGITPDNLGQLLTAGVAAVAVSSAALAADDPQALCRRLRDMLHRKPA